MHLNNSIDNCHSTLPTFSKSDDNQTHQPHAITVGK